MKTGKERASGGARMQSETVRSARRKALVCQGSLLIEHLQELLVEHLALLVTQGQFWEPSSASQHATQIPDQLPGRKECLPLCFGAQQFPDLGIERPDVIEPCQAPLLQGFLELAESLLGVLHMTA